MSNPGLNIKLPKARGEWAELRFMARAAEQGLTVSKPWGESQHYDFVVEHESCLLRVQVKSTTARRNRNYACMLRGGRTLYTATDFDYLAVLIIPLDLWYIIPIAVAITGRRKLHLSPDYPRSIYEPYRENWDQLKQKLCSSHKNTDLCFRQGCQNRVERDGLI